MKISFLDGILQMNILNEGVLAERYVAIEYFHPLSAGVLSVLNLLSTFSLSEQTREQTLWSFLLTEAYEMNEINLLSFHWFLLLTGRQLSK